MTSGRDRLTELRRDLHRHPEPAWREFYTTARLVEEIGRVGVDDLHVGPDAIDGDARLAVPDEASLAEWSERARDAGADPGVLAQLEGGHTGAVAVLEQGEGPTVALRVDIDALPVTEADTDDHAPASAGFRSENEGYMHACGHDAHAALGIGVLEAVKESDFAGTFKLCLQPAEEVVGGGKAMAESGHLDDVDALYAIHVGLDHPTGEVVAGVDGFLAVHHVAATFRGASAHAGAKPEEGRNTVQAMASAVQALYGIPRHSEGATRVNVGTVEAGTAVNVVPERADIEAEFRGETTELKDYMVERAESALAGAAATYDCEVDVETVGEAPSAVSDDALVDVVHGVASTDAGVTTPTRTDALGGSEDATVLMRRVQERGGQACYVIVGTDHSSGHHTPTFDVDESSLDVGVRVLSGSVLETFETLAE
ncbi:amidohydrolase [Halarchaeum sp. P4]|uniref:amidohydrolase n=1 Tax=Halarchaeum sp. P4 TaxID=3421639 RepID=UPI003EB92DDC